MTNYRILKTILPVIIMIMEVSDATNNFIGIEQRIPDVQT